MISIRFSVSGSGTDWVKIISVFPFSKELKRTFGLSVSSPPPSSSSSPSSSVPPPPAETIASISAGIALIISFCAFAVSAVHPAELYAASAVSILADISEIFAASRLASFAVSFVFAVFTALISAYLSGAFDEPSAELYVTSDKLSIYAPVGFDFFEPNPIPVTVFDLAVVALG